MTDFDDVPLHIGMTTDPGCSFPAPPFNAYQARAASDMRNDLLTAASLARDEHTARLRLLRLCAHPSFAAVAFRFDSLADSRTGPRPSFPTGSASRSPSAASFGRSPSQTGAFFA